jgi:hypothetical protein
MIVCLLTFGDPRFRHPVDPLIAILAGVGIVTLFFAVAGHIRGKNIDRVNRTS